MNFRERLEQSKTGAIAPAENEIGYRNSYFATDKSKTPACIEFRLPDGVRRALPYPHITELNYDVENGIEIYTSSKRIAITGRNLAQLFDYLAMYRVRYIETHNGGDFGEDGLFVDEISIEDLID